MPGLLGNPPASDALRRSNDTHNAGVVVLVLFAIGVYAYLFTYIARPFDLLPAQVADHFGITVEHVFDDDGNVDSNVGILMTQRFDTNDEERLIYYGLLALAFLSAYFLPVAWKRTALVCWAAVGIDLLYGVSALAGLLAAHLAVYLLLHPGRHPLLAAAAGALAFLANPFYPQDSLSTWLLLVGVALGTAVGYEMGVRPLLDRPRIAAVLRCAAVYAALVVIAVSLLLESTGGEPVALSLGTLLFLWQWARLAMYHVDYTDGQVPADISPMTYLSVFVSPAVIPNWSWGVTIGQGYTYLQNSFLCQNKNRIVMAGVKLLAIALLYLVLWRWVHLFLVGVVDALGIDVYGGFTRRMVRAFASGADVSSVSVLLTTMLDLVRFMLFLAGVMHFKVAVWRLCGYSVDAYYDKPWLATNLMAFWSRFAFHYREFLVRLFYYPVFFRCFRRHRALRIITASMAAAAFGNFIWHITERAFFHEPDLQALSYVFGTWPYFVLLGAGIAVSQLVLLSRRRTRKPWTPDRWLAADFAAAYITMQYFALIHIFARPAENASVADMTWLFLRAFGLEGGAR